jgi:long-chain acyl-CoA synthetase
MIGIGAHARATPDATAVVAGRSARTFEDLDARERVLAGLLNEHGIGGGDRIAVLAGNRMEALEVVTGALRAGVVPVLVNSLLAPPEVAYQLEDSGARWVFTDRPIEVPPSVERVVTFGDAYERCLHDADTARLAMPPAGAELGFADVVLGRPMHYTSGTTGRPKGVWVKPTTPESAARISADFCREWGLVSDDVYLVCSPLAHSAPLRFAIRTLEAGGTVVLQNRFDAEETLAAIELFGVTATFMVPTHLERIFALGELTLARHDLSTMRLLAHAGAPIRAETKFRALEFFPEGSVWEFYGSTEGAFTRISPTEWRKKPGSVGTPRPGAEILVLDEQGRSLPPKEIGTLWLRDPRTERFEYWGDESKTRSAWRDGAFTVGDLGYLDEDGYLFLVGRADDTIITGGINVYPQEVEAVLLDHPAVAQATVYGVPHDEWGQQVRAMVVPAPNAPLDAELLRSWARERLAGFKCPRQIEVVDALPTTPTGKVRRPSS